MIVIVHFLIFCIKPYFECSDSFLRYDDLTRWLECKKDQVIQTKFKFEFAGAKFLLNIVSPFN